MATQLHTLAKLIERGALTADEARSAFLGVIGLCTSDPLPLVLKTLVSLRDRELLSSVQFNTWTSVLTRQSPTTTIFDLFSSMRVLEKIPLINILYEMFWSPPRLADLNVLLQTVGVISALLLTITGSLFGVVSHDELVDADARFASGSFYDLANTTPAHFPWGSPNGMWSGAFLQSNILAFVFLFCSLLFVILLAIGLAAPQLEHRIHFQRFWGFARYLLSTAMVMLGCGIIASMHSAGLLCVLKSPDSATAVRAWQLMNILFYTLFAIGLTTLSLCTYMKASPVVPMPFTMPTICASGAPTMEQSQQQQQQQQQQQKPLQSQQPLQQQQQQKQEPFTSSLQSHIVPVHVVGSSVGGGGSSNSSSGVGSSGPNVFMSEGGVASGRQVGAVALSSTQTIATTTNPVR
eukprot:gnl/Spiro4/22934_TR11318_c0_g1_i1.p1 gnl/Spiro4/22934_TR11318_c0_g1~~gnl/Spiro4/22934_TR11318_c0_g1_i1.p1  ORF type:complete len:407 (+),score=139.91 gnl/Spiro4/22934_TR11318_c0_g1_i1:375-1595(+)